MKKVNYDSSIVEAVEEINSKKKKGEEIHPLTEEGLKAIDVANMIISSIMKKSKPDLGFFKIYMNSTNERINKMSTIEDNNIKINKKIRRKRTNFKK